MKEEILDEICAIKTNNFDSDIMRVRDFFFKESLSWSGDFQQNANKFTLFWKVYMLGP